MGKVVRIPPVESSPSSRQQEPAPSVFARVKAAFASTVVDTITTRFLLLFLFLLVIPLSAVIIFTVSLLANHMAEASEAQLQLSRNLLVNILDEQQEKLALLDYLSNRSDPDRLERICGEFSGMRCWPGTHEGVMEGKALFQQPRPGFFEVQDGKLYAMRRIETGSNVRLAGVEIDQAILNQIYRRQPYLQTEIWILPEPFQAEQPQWFARHEINDYHLPVNRLLGRLESDIRSENITLDAGGTTYQISQTFLYSAEQEKIARLVHVLPLTKQQMLLSNYYLGIYIISVLSLLFSVLLAMLAGRTITQPLLTLIRQVNTLSRSNVMTDEVAVRGVHEINQLSEAFNRMIKRLQQEHKIKDEFVATLTHDLKVPLIAEKQTLAYYQQEAYGPLTPDQQEVMEVLQSSNRSCLSLVNGLLEVYRYESGEVALVHENFNLVRLMNETAGELHSLAQEKSISVTLEFDVDAEGDEPLVYADRLEIKRVLHNLLSNAIINTPPHGKINCRITNMRHYGSELVYKVSNFQSTTLKAPVKLDERLLVIIQDSGIGFSNEDLPNLFKQFAASKGRNPMSIGLGLYNCYQVISAHNGVLWVESTEGEGTTVSFVLPGNQETAQDRRVFGDRRKKGV